MQLAIFSPFQLFSEDTHVVGLRLSLLYGKNADLAGVDFGLGVNSAHNVKGIQIAGVSNEIAGYPQEYAVKGLQIAGLGNTADYLYGVQIGGFGNGVTFDVIGIQVSLFGNSARKVTGVQITGFSNDNYLKDSIVNGVQVGALNYSAHVNGVQIGLYNACKTMTGVQIGLINTIENGRFPILPIVNAQF